MYCRVISPYHSNIQAVGHMIGNKWRLYIVELSFTQHLDFAEEFTAWNIWKWMCGGNKINMGKINMIQRGRYIIT